MHQHFATFLCRAITSMEHVSSYRCRAVKERGHSRAVQQYFLGYAERATYHYSKSRPADGLEAVKSEKWTFCSDGQPIFPVMLTPAHSRRWSRHMFVPIIAPQLKWVLIRLLGTPETRKDTTGKVRKLLEAFDQVEIGPDLIIW